MDKVTLCNIGPSQRRRRLLVGLPILLAGFLGSLFSSGFVGPLVGFFGFLSIFQAQAGTCVALAAAGSRNMDSGKESVDNPQHQAFFQRQSRAIYLRSFLATLILILIAQRQAVLNILRSVSA